jgi:hypothetical protein
MSFLKDLFSRAPRLPEPVYDPFGGDETARAAIAALGKPGGWRDVAVLMAQAGSDDRAFLAGSIAETGNRAAVDAWHAAQRDRPEPWLVRGLLRIGEAWAVRGSGRASDVDEESWPVFHAGLREAEQDLREAIRLAPDDATPWGYLLLTGRGLEKTVSELRALFEEARRRDPQGWLAPYMALDAVSEKWSGTHEEMFAFVREVTSAEREGSPLHALVPLAHVERWLSFSTEDPPDRKAQQGWFGRRDVQEEIRKAWQRGPQSPAFRPGRFVATQLNSFAFAFSLGGDAGRARELFQQIGARATRSPWSHLGDPVAAFKRARQEAFSG